MELLLGVVKDAAGKDGSSVPHVPGLPLYAQVRSQATDALHNALMGALQAPFARVCCAPCSCGSLADAGIVFLQRLCESPRMFAESTAAVQACRRSAQLQTIVQHV